MCPVSHVNIQIVVQYITNEPEEQDRYGKITKTAKKSVREERINLTSGTAAGVFERAKAALEVLGG